MQKKEKPVTKTQFVGAVNYLLTAPIVTRNKKNFIAYSNLSMELFLDCFHSMQTIKAENIKKRRRKQVENGK